MPSIYIRDSLFLRWAWIGSEEDPENFNQFVNKCVERCLELEEKE